MQRNRGNRCSYPWTPKKPNVQSERLSMKLYNDANLEVVKKSNDEALQVSQLYSSTHVLCIDVSWAPVPRCSGRRRFGPVSRQHDDVQSDENTPMMCAFQTWRHTWWRGEERERELNGWMRRGPWGSSYMSQGGEVGLPGVAVAPSLPCAGFGVHRSH
jgi:hypothetical protein